MLNTGLGVFGLKKKVHNEKRVVPDIGNNPIGSLSYELLLG